MFKRQKKCPSCGLVNFRDAAQCQWCALALRDRVQTGLIDDAPRASRGPWGVMLIMLAVASLCGGIVWHVTRKAVVRAEQLANEKLEPSPAQQAKRTGPPSLSGRSPSDPVSRQTEDVNERFRRVMEQHAEIDRRRSEDSPYSPEQAHRVIEERARQRQIEERQRHAEEPPPDMPDDR